MSEIGKLLVAIGILIIAVGVVLWSGFGKAWLGRLPGDFHYERGNFGFYFPLATSLLLSLFLTLLFWLLRR